MSSIAVYSRSVYPSDPTDNDDCLRGASIHFEYPKVTLPFETPGERLNAINDARTVIQAQQIRDRADRYERITHEYYIVEQIVVEQL